MTDSPQLPRRREIWRALLFIFLGLFLLACLLWLGPNLISKRRLERYKQREQAAGERFNLAEFLPKPVPDESNFALAPVVASSYEGELDKNGKAIYPHKNVVNRLDMPIYYGKSRRQPPEVGNWALGQATDMKTLQDYYRSLAGEANAYRVGAQPQSPAADVLLALSKYDETIEELRRAAARPESRFPLNYDCQPPAAILLPHLGGLKDCSQVLELRAVAELQNGQSNQALADVTLVLRLAASVRSEPFLVSHLDRIDMVKLALQPVWEGMQEHRWSDSQLKELDRDLAGLDFLADYEFSVRAERALQLEDIEYMRRTRNVGGFFANGDMPVATEIELRFALDSVYYKNELAFSRACQDWILPIVNEEQRSVSLKALQLAETNINRMRSNWSLDNVLPAMLLPMFPNLAERYSCGQSSVDMARIAIALERFRLAHGKYPESLNALAPGYIKSVPSDIIGGNPLIYHSTKDGRFVLYSVGWNGTDDGGTVFFKGSSTNSIDYEKGDWVWAGQVIGP